MACLCGWPDKYLMKAIPSEAWPTLILWPSVSVPIVKVACPVRSYSLKLNELTPQPGRLKLSGLLPHAGWYEEKPTIQPTLYLSVAEERKADCLHHGRLSDWRLSREERVPVYSISHLWSLGGSRLSLERRLTIEKVSISYFYYISISSSHDYLQSSRGNGKRGSLSTEKEELIERKATRERKAERKPDLILGTRLICRWELIPVSYEGKPLWRKLKWPSMKVSQKGSSSVWQWKK